MNIDWGLHHHSIMYNHCHVAPLLDIINNHFLSSSFTQIRMIYLQLVPGLLFSPHVICLITALPSIHHDMFLL